MEHKGPFPRGGRAPGEDQAARTGVEILPGLPGRVSEEYLAGFKDREKDGQTTQTNNGGESVGLCGILELSYRSATPSPTRGRRGES